MVAIGLLLFAGALLALVALIGIVAMRTRAARARELRRQRDALQSSFFFETFAGNQTEDPGQYPAGPSAR